ncbi:hypothetical protein ACIQZM_13750 [Peribacillus sp. NPDC097206]|uniref:hypothetical protein n=1 Tax=Peribacillus sp. NPDC097206 TaxID=3364398 RepID=UPI0038203435
MSTTIKQSVYEEIRKDFENIQYDVDNIHNMYYNKLFFTINFDTKGKIDTLSSMIDEIKIRIIVLKTHLNFIINKTNTKNIDDYVQLLDYTKDFEYDLGKIEVHMN